MSTKPVILLRSGLILAIWANLAGCGFEPHVEPLEIPPPPGTALPETFQAPGTPPRRGHSRSYPLYARGCFHVCRRDRTVRHSRALWG